MQSELFINIEKKVRILCGFSLRQMIYFMPTSNPKFVSFQGIYVVSSTFCAKNVSRM